jgi:hypothetical protein
VRSRAHIPPLAFVRCSVAVASPASALALLALDGSSSRSTSRRGISSESLLLQGLPVLDGLALAFREDSSHLDLSVGVASNVRSRRHSRRRDADRARPAALVRRRSVSPFCIRTSGAAPQLRRFCVNESEPSSSSTRGTSSRKALHGHTAPNRAATDEIPGLPGPINENQIDERGATT